MTIILFFAALSMSLPVAGAVCGVVVCWRDRRRLARAFARGRTEHVVRISPSVEPIPELRRLEAV